MATVQPKAKAESKGTGNTRPAVDVGRFEVVLGELKKPWFDFCKARKIKPSAAVKKAIARLMQAGQGVQVFSVEPVIEKKSRIEIQLTKSERAAAERRALEEGFSSANLWVTATVRAALTNTPQFGQIEIEALGRSNLQLMAIGRNLNQIAKRLNAAKSDADIRDYDSALVEDLAAAVRLHVKKVGDALRASIYRWRVK